jgi:uncharacterized protein YbaP (TraB family)
MIQQYGVAPQTPLSSQLTPEENAAGSCGRLGSGRPGAQMDIFRPWYAGLTLSIAPLKKAGYDPASGVELVAQGPGRGGGQADPRLRDD